MVIAKQPQRVAVTHFGMMEYFFALETPPIASTLAERMLGSFETLKPYAKTATVKDIGEVTTPNLELMTELEPDLIVAFSGTHNDVYEDLSHISTVAMINNTEERTWAETLREYAKLIGKEQLAEDYITKLEALMAEAGEKLAAKKDKTVTFLRASGDGSTFYVLDDNDVSNFPDGYADSDQRYPVVYLQDSGDLIEPNDSDTLLKVRELTAKGELPGMIFVGVASFDRNDEYTPFVSPNVFEPGKMFGGNASVYARFLANELKPYIDSKLRTLPDREHTGIMGFSFGGLISVYTAFAYPDFFGRIGSFSGSFWFPGIIEWLEQLPIRQTGQRLYMNLGHAEGAGRTNGQQWMVPNSKKVYELLLQNGFTESTVRQVIYESEYHSFDLGVQYVPEALQWLFRAE
ncbi:putative hydrolase of alpha/beta superfamily [Brevibacillus sp. CF112]|nr:putative hydrolase of alpha/beta superfamily [Brevibacillus sp. CF112]